jgi:hypothetical protein
MVWRIVPRLDFGDGLTPVSNVIYHRIVGDKALCEGDPNDERCRGLYRLSDHKCSVCLWVETNRRTETAVRDLLAAPEDTPANQKPKEDPPDDLDRV